jgi:alcohol dehydrogenase
MKAWRLDRLGGTLRLEDAPIPEPRPGSVIVKIEASALMSYLKSYVEGRLPIYSPPDGPFTPGGNAIGIVHGVGREVYHVKAGQRVVVSSHIVADENAPEPAQFLFGITAGPAGKALQTDWRAQNWRLRREPPTAWKLRARRPRPVSGLAEGGLQS